ncbi:hypothetical protein IQ268_28285 [Oculatella sp. LEGE 06141]|uniref:hypothetical protein n=1 Tax=Oculatella sp. LEGE 06141 TaxID=1828648 RepID=UPI00187F69F9|nr:hypothetical protein [Oculatella sp. LEGE 06141]MBE9182452.1 hypothetical protein [Oculatella sp. LEGE 06141]
MALTPRDSRTEKTKTSKTRSSRTKSGNVVTDAVDAVTSAVTGNDDGSGSIISNNNLTSFDLSHIGHGLTIQTFDTNANLSPSLYEDLSPLPRTSKLDADRAVESIEEKKQTLRIIQSNLSLNQEVVRTGVSNEKLIGNVIDFATAKTNNQSKFIGYQAAGVNLSTAEVKLQQAKERHAQESIALGGMKDLTPLIEEEWDQKKKLKQSRIEDLRASVYIANAKIEQAMSQAQNNDIAQVANSVD